MKRILSRYLTICISGWCFFYHHFSILEKLCCMGCPFHLLIHIIWKICKSFLTVRNCNIYDTFFILYGSSQTEIANMPFMFFRHKKYVKYIKVLKPNNISTISFRGDNYRGCDNHSTDSWVVVYSWKMFRPIYFCIVVLIRYTRSSMWLLKNMASCLLYQLWEVYSFISKVIDERNNEYLIVWLTTR
jgi:hypothetical protein